jgi:hypothetical protein
MRLKKGRFMGARLRPDKREREKLEREKLGEQKLARV